MDMENYCDEVLPVHVIEILLRFNGFPCYRQILTAIWSIRLVSLKNSEIQNPILHVQD